MGQIAEELLQFNQIQNRLTNPAQHRVHRTGLSPQDRSAICKVWRDNI